MEPILLAKRDPGKVLKTSYFVKQKKGYPELSRDRAQTAQNVLSKPDRPPGLEKIIRLYLFRSLSLCFVAHLFGQVLNDSFSSSWF